MSPYNEAAILADVGQVADLESVAVDARGMSQADRELIASAGVRFNDTDDRLMFSHLQAVLASEYLTIDLEPTLLNELRAVKASPGLALDASPFARTVALAVWHGEMVEYSAG